MSYHKYAVPAHKDYGLKPDKTITEKRGKKGKFDKKHIYIWMILPTH